MNRVLGTLFFALALTACMPKYAVFDVYRAEREVGEPVYIVPLTIDSIEDFVSLDSSRVQSVALYIERNTARENPINWSELPGAITVAQVQHYDPWRGSSVADPNPANEIFVVGNVTGEGLRVQALTGAPEKALERTVESPWLKWVVVGREPVLVTGTAALLAELRAVHIEQTALASMMETLEMQGLAETDTSTAVFQLSPRTWRLVEPRPVGREVNGRADGLETPFYVGDRKEAREWETAFLQGLDSIPPQRAPVRLVCMRPKGTGKCFEPGRRYRIRVQQDSAQIGSAEAIAPADFTFLVEKRDFWASMAIGLTTLAGLVWVMTY